MPQIVYLLRHGEATSNIKRVWSFKGDLTPVGIKQAEYWADYFKEKDIIKIYASTVSRTSQTAEIIAQELGLGVEKRNEIVEADGGNFMERNVDLPEKRALEEELFSSWEKGKWMKSYPNGESFNDLRIRFENLVEDLPRSGNLLIVSHQMPIAVFLWTFCINHPDKFLGCWLSRAGMVKVERIGKNKFKILELNVKPEVY